MLFDRFQIAFASLNQLFRGSPILVGSQFRRSKDDPQTLSHATKQMMASLGGLDYFGPSAFRDAEIQRAERAIRDGSKGIEDLSSPVVSCKSQAESSSGQESNRITSSHSKSTRDNSSATRSSRAPSERSLEDKGEIVIEERRRRSDGEGYTTHRYVRGRMLGKGGFAKVYLCTSMDTGKSYAVKIVPKTNLVKARARQKVREKVGGI